MQTEELFIEVLFERYFLAPFVLALEIKIAQQAAFSLYKAVLSNLFQEIANNTKRRLQ
jgi:hypothetical protein